MNHDADTIHLDIHDRAALGRDIEMHYPLEMAQELYDLALNNYCPRRDERELEVLEDLLAGLGKLCRESFTENEYLMEDTSHLAQCPLLSADPLINREGVRGRSYIIIEDRDDWFIEF